LQHPQTSVTLKLRPFAVGGDGAQQLGVDCDARRLRAAQTGDYGTVLRLARVAAGLTLEEAASLAGVSASTLSRMETKPGRSWDIRDLRRLAAVFAIPAHLFGLSRSTFDVAPANLSTGVDRDGDEMRRRDLIAMTAVALTGAVTLPAESVNAAKGMADTIEDVIFGRVAAEPLAGNQLAAQLAAAHADFQATRYSQLAQRLPRLLAQAEAARDAASVNEAALAATRLAQAYNVTTQLLAKLHDNGIAWATADRAVQAAREGDNPLVLAEARRLAATETAWTLLAEADEAARRLEAARADRFSMLDLAAYKISVSRVLGDFGIAVDYARPIDPVRIVSPERRARFWQDTALALHGRGRPQAAFHALLSAEKDTPQEVRFRPWARQLTRELLSHSSLPGMREFASRIGAL
jgi:transcriptional regulator with XRE-family HTH domain/tetratricopeptide (TPR) repeat protein